MLVKHEVLKKRVKVQLFPNEPEDIATCKAISNYTGVSIGKSGMIEIELLRISLNDDKIEYEEVNEIEINSYIEGEQ